VNGLFGLPFLFGSPFGVEANLSLYRRDSTFLDIKSQLSLSYLLSNGFTLKAFYLFSGSNLLSGAGNNPSFSALSNTRSNVYGLNLSKKKLDYIPNPSKGYWLVFDAGIGGRKAMSSDTAEWTPQTTYRTSLSIEYYLPVYKRHVLKMHVRGSLYYAPIIYQNEAFRIGGLSTLRGFNEEELFVTSFMTTTIEYRYLLERNSALFAFFDQAFYENSSANHLTDMPFGFGGGFSFGTNLGIFSISYGLGKQLNNPILVRNGKVHFGYIAYF
jgi:outer membrane protein assembly factor BamA